MLCFQDHLVFPATEYNATQRPKMSFMIMAPPNSKLSLLAGGGTPHLKGVGMLVVSLRGENFGFRFHLGCFGQNAIISCEGLA